MRPILQFGCFAAWLLLCLPALAQLNSGAQGIALTATLGESLTVTLSSSNVNFTLTQGSPTNNGSTLILARTQWKTTPGKSVSLYAYFASSASALSDGSGNNIPSAAFSISDNFSAFNPLSQTVPFGASGGGLKLFTTQITAANKIGNHFDILRFNINLSTVSIPAGLYTGTLNIQAQAI